MKQWNLRTREVNSNLRCFCDRRLLTPFLCVCWESCAEGFDTALKLCLEPGSRWYPWLPACSTGLWVLEVLGALTPSSFPWETLHWRLGFCSTLNSTETPPNLHSLLVIAFGVFSSLHTVSDDQIWVKTRCHTAETGILKTHSFVCSGCRGFLTPQKTPY